MTKLRLIWIFSVLTCSMIFNNFVFAQGESTEPIENPFTANTIVITANKIPNTLENIGGSSVSVVSSKQIDLSRKHQVEEILKTIPGIDIVSNGGPGTSSSVFIRGADSKNTLVLIDGVAFNDPSSIGRSANIGVLTLDNIERIEIVRGSQSVLYGSNATAGVVNIITKRGKKSPEFHVGLELGSYNTKRVFGGFSGRTKNLEYSLFGSNIESGGFSIADKRNDQIPQNGNTDEEDAWQNYTQSARFRYFFTKDFDVSLNLRASKSQAYLDEYYFSGGYVGDRFSTATAANSWTSSADPDGEKNARVESKQSLQQIDVHNFFMNRILESTFTLNQSKHDRVGYSNDNVEKYDYKGQKEQLAWQGNFYLGEHHILTLGLSNSIEKMESDSASISGVSAKTQSVWIQDKMLYFDESLNFVVGGRQVEHGNFGKATVYRLAPSFEVASTNTLLKMSFGTGFRAPSLYELYSSYGNTGLDPELSISRDYGIEQKLMNNSLKIGITRFKMEFTDRIAYDFNTSLYEQAKGKTTTQGYENFISYSPNKSVQTTLNYTNTKTEDPDNKQLIRRPERKYNANLSLKILNDTTVNANMKWVGERVASTNAKDKNGEAVKSLEAYSVLDVAFTHTLTGNFNLYGRIDNLTDTFYEEAWSYATPGRSVMIGIKASFR